jgi:hypothetical protein
VAASSTCASLAELHAPGEHELFRRRFIGLTRLVTMLGLCLLLPIVAFNHALIVSLAALWEWVFVGTGQLAKLVPLSVASAMVNLLVSVSFTWMYSKTDLHRALLGPVLGTASAYALLTLPILPWLLRKQL